MKLTLLASGERANFTTLAFDPNNETLEVVANYPAPYNVSWVEPVCSHGTVDSFVGLSEGEESGLLFTFEIDQARSICNITSQQSTLGAPAHFITLRDKSALALGTYLGGSVALYPVQRTRISPKLLTDGPRTEFLPEHPYRLAGQRPNRVRQRQCHIHQIIEDKRGFIYAPDLGSDRVWILCRDRMRLDVCGWLQCPPGSGPRHAQLTPDERIMYVIGELSHTVVAFELANSPAENMQPVEGFSPNIIPPSVHSDHQALMDSAELCLHPSTPNVFYASNRWERHIAQREPHLQGVPEDLVTGDAIAIVLLSDNGKEVQNVKFVRTKLDTIRGMRLSKDGNHVAVGGQKGGGVEIYRISGERGDVWTLVTELKENLENGIKHIIWL